MKRGIDRLITRRKLEAQGRAGRGKLKTSVSQTQRPVPPGLHASESTATEPKMAGPLDAETSRLFYQMLHEQCVVVIKFRLTKYGQNKLLGGPASVTR